MRTYIVEDSSIVLENLVAALEELTPVQVVGSASEEVAAVDWLLLCGSSCELLIIDVFLHAGSGLGVLNAIKDGPFAGKRVVLSNFATRDLRVACHALGADRVFDKTEEIDDLINYCIGLARSASATFRVVH